MRIIDILLWQTNNKVNLYACEILKIIMRYYCF